MQLGLNRQVRVVTSEYILQEVEEVLQRHGYTTEKARQTRVMLASAFKIISLTRAEALEAATLTRDLKDTPVLAAAMKAKAILVTGDKELLREANKAGIRALRTWEVLDGLGSD